MPNKRWIRPRRMFPTFQTRRGRGVSVGLFSADRNGSRRNEKNEKTNNDDEDNDDDDYNEGGKHETTQDARQ